MSSQGGGIADDKPEENNMCAFRVRDEPQKTFLIIFKNIIIDIEVAE